MSLLIINDSLVGVDLVAGSVNFIADVEFLKNIIDNVDIWKEAIPPASEWTPSGILDITSAPEEQVSTKTMLDLVSVILHNNKAREYDTIIRHRKRSSKTN